MKSSIAIFGTIVFETFSLLDSTKSLVLLFFFRHYETFSPKFFISPNGPLFGYFDFIAVNWIIKNPKGSHFCVFRTVRFFSKFLKSFELRSLLNYCGKDLRIFPTRLFGIFFSLRESLHDIKYNEYNGSSFYKSFSIHQTSKEGQGSSNGVSISWSNSKLCEVCLHYTIRFHFTENRC